MWFFDPVGFLVFQGARVEEEDEDLSGSEVSFAVEHGFRASPETDVFAPAFGFVFVAGDCYDGSVEEEVCGVAAVVGKEKEIDGLRKQINGHYQALQMCISFLQLSVRSLSPKDIQY